ncbi:MAG TPA: LuxR C-terminal-related transcriptional regulator [Ktedonobacteraceae bacterium]|jgi:ATP/maltotriose-dependent transcriptional regulator MalT
MNVLNEEKNASQQQRHTNQCFPPFALLRTKLAIPSLRPHILPRPHLVAEINKGLDFKLTLISAPAGFGKTTLLSEWACQRMPPLIWISLSESDNDPAQFWTYVSMALASLSEQVASRVLELLSHGRYEAIQTELTNVLVSLPQEFVLVLDDYHTIQNEAIHTAVISLLEYLPWHIRVVIASRTRPPFPLSRLRAYRQLYELRPADLLFTPPEVELFFIRTLGRTLSPELVETITAQTEGWIAILNLIAIWAQEQKGDEEMLRHISDQHPYILEYLEDEILHRQVAEIQRFLLQTSILSRFNCSLCNELTEQTGSHLLLEQLWQANLFLTPCSTQPDWYSYQPFFQSFLHRRLTQIFPGQLPTLHRRASAWYEKQEMYADALFHMLTIQDYEKSADILLNHGDAILLRSEADTLLPLLKDIPVSQKNEALSKLNRQAHRLLEELARDTAEIEAPTEQAFGPSPRIDLSYELSERELDILQGITIGLSNQEIARQMVIAESTVKWHIKNIYSKLQVHNRVQAIIKAQKLQLLYPYHTIRQASPRKGCDPLERGGGGVKGRGGKTLLIGSDRVQTYRLRFSL